MCGIVGVLSGGRSAADLIRRLSAELIHRGPDDSGVWSDPEASVALAHRRLAIVDLTPGGHQPMVSHSGRYVITYNGEIYNHADLRAGLDRTGLTPEGGWRGHSDTETLLELISGSGLERALDACAGMFAFALWDREERSLCLVRDRFGEKPLYFGWVGRDFVFASELKGIRSHPDFNNEISREAVTAYSARGYVPAPLSIYRRIFKLEPGTILKVGANAALRSTDLLDSADGVAPTRYWSYATVLENGLRDPIADEGEALELLDSAIREVVGQQSLADVDVGAFLSGGIDSSMIVAASQKESGRKVRTFTIGFSESAFNEAEHAKEIARYLGSIHSELYVSPAEARAVIPLLPRMYDEPFGDSSQIPTFLVSHFAAKQVKVALSGDGGDEIFGGYRRYMSTISLWRWLKRIPRPLRRIVGGPATMVPPRIWNALVRTRENDRHQIPGGRIQKAIRAAANAATFEDFYAAQVNLWAHERSPVLDGAPVGPFRPKRRIESDTVNMLYWDAVSYLPDDILCKVDRASMAVSLEARAPFLDHRVAEVAARIPMHMKIRGEQGKLITRKLLGRYLPPHLLERPKTGFSMPIGDWLRGPLRDWAEDLLDQAKLAGEGWFDPATIHARWSEHLRGDRDSAHALWSLLMFQSWLRAQG